jgi:Bacterial extracellular solute-binding proteins, family 3
MKHTTHLRIAKASRNRSATWWRLNLLSCVLLLVAFWQPSFAENPKSGGFPSFRHVDLAAKLAETSSGGAITLLADDDFAPWSFRGADGHFQGVSVELAQQACAEAGYTCEIRPAAFATILTALEKADAQGVVSGPKLDAALASKFALTRPYFQSLGRFAIRTCQRQISEVLPVAALVFATIRLTANFWKHFMAAQPSFLLKHRTPCWKPCAPARLM